MATKTFKNYNEMKIYFDEVMRQVIESVSDKLLKDFRDHLDKTVYGAPTGEYVRYKDNGGFLSGWKISEDISKKAQEYVRSLVFDGSLLIAPQDDMINSQMSHGGRDGSDIRELMAMVLNNIADNDYYSYNGGANYLEGNKGYWDSYISDLNDKVIGWFDGELKKYGI